MRNSMLPWLAWLALLANQRYGRSSSVFSAFGTRVKSRLSSSPESVCCNALLRLYFAKKPIHLETVDW